jgi:hypothetical protein
MSRPEILNECHICGEPHTLARMVHKWDFSYCLICWGKVTAIVEDFNTTTTTQGTEQ